MARVYDPVEEVLVQHAAKAALYLLNDTYPGVKAASRVIRSGNDVIMVRVTITEEVAATTKEPTDDRSK